MGCHLPPPRSAADVTKEVAVTQRPLQITIMNDYELVVAGVIEMLKPYADRVGVVEVDAHERPALPVDIVLFDTFGSTSSLTAVVKHIERHCLADRVVLYTWEPTPQAVSAARSAGINALISKALPASELVEALEQIHQASGFVVRSDPAGQVDELGSQPNRCHDWPGSTAQLSMREAEMVALICQGKSNSDIAQQTSLSPNSVKAYIRSAYRKMGVTTRAQAVAWGISHGFLPQPCRLHLADP